MTTFFSVLFYFDVCLFQKWRSKMPAGAQWISGLSRGVSSRAALRLFVVSLCVLITLLMAILNFVSFSDLCLLLNGS